MLSGAAHPILTKKLSRQLEKVLGPFEFRHSLSHPYGINTVLALQTGKGKLVICKQYHQVRRYHQERVFLMNYTAVLGTQAPQIIADFGASAGHEPIMLLTGLPGVIVAESEHLDPAELVIVYEQAGQLLRRLHDQFYADTDALSAAEAVRVRLNSAVAEAPAYGIQAAELEHARAIIGRAEIFESVARVPCHRDFSPRNWLFQSATAAKPGQLKLIDFDMARPDFRIGDFLRLRDEYTVEQPELWQALQRGYGQELSVTEEEQLRQLSLISAISTIIWAQRFGDVPFEQTARRIFARRLEG